jgi:predicted transposase/invertase (TIGR01784 family)
MEKMYIYNYRSFDKRIEEEFKMPYLASWERSAKREGKKEGRKEGIDKEKIRTAKMMIKKGFDLDTIMDITNLDRKEIERLIATSH